MSDLDFARAQMGVSLAFHIVFAATGVGLPVIMTLSEWRWLATGEPEWKRLAKMWAKGTAVLFAVGAVSGTVLSFELGLLWPHFMAFSGSVIGYPFALEGFAFFTEAIFLGLYLYGWDKLSPRVHLACGVVVAASGALSAIFVTMANAWMNHPAGLSASGAIDIEPLHAMLSPGWLQEVIHVLLSSYESTAFGVAGVHAALLLAIARGRGPSNAAPVHRRALALALVLGGVTAVLQPVSGDESGRKVGEKQPAKFAAIEALYQTQHSAPLLMGGLADSETRTVRGAIAIPHMVSFLATHDPDGEVAGLDRIPRDQWPDVRSTHLEFQAMVGCGMLLAGLSILLALLRWRKGRGALESPRILQAIIAASPLGFVALEMGWMVTERGRQPWIIQGVMRTTDAVTPMPGLIVPFLGVVALYLFLGVATAFLLSKEIRTLGFAAGEPTSPKAAA